MTGINTKLTVISVVLLLLTLVNISPAIAAEKEVGKTLLARGSVIGKRSSGDVTLKRRSLVFEKDEIHVGKDGRAQFRMIDQALISLQENSVLQIKNYQFQKGGRNNSALLELLSGGLRTITGAIGKGNKKAYELRTPLATIGIRGTDYEVEIVSNGMYVAVWDGVIHLRARLKNGCNMLIGSSQPFMFVFIDRLGKCRGLAKVPDVFRAGHSSNVTSKKQERRVAIIGARRSFAQRLVIEPLLQASPGALTPATTFDFDAFTIDQSNPSNEAASRATVLDSSEPTFKVGLNLYDNVAGGAIQGYQQSVGGYPVSWGSWDDFSTSLAGKSLTSTNASNLNGLIWATYKASDPEIVSARTGTFSRYENITDSLLSSSAGLVSNLQIQMDVNFETGNVTNGALSVNTPTDTWVAVFDGTITSGDLDLDLNGASVIDSNPSTASPARDASGFIAGDFVGDNAEAIVGAFGLSEDNANAPNDVEGVFVVEE